LGKLRPVRDRRIAAVVVPLALTVLAGCAAAGDRGPAAADVASRMLTAVDGKDGASACSLLAPDTASEVAQSGGKSCPQAILDENLPKPGAVTATAVYGQWAQVRIGDDTVFLAAFPGGWRVVAAGCKSQGPRPYNCDVHGG
jgi:hypothetical protein